MQTLVIGHRGAAGYRPEHTLESYTLAVELGADLVEPDLVITKDGVLIARHENELSRSTDVAEHPELAHLCTTKVVDGRPATGWFSEDLTLAQVKTLRARERMAQLRPWNAMYDGRSEVPTLQEVFDVVADAARRQGRGVGVLAEMKSATHFAGCGLHVDDALVELLDRNGYNRPDAPVQVQTFETTLLRGLSRRLLVPLLQLVGAAGAPYDLVARNDRRTYADLISPSGLREISTYAAGIGPDKQLVVPTVRDSRLGEPTDLVRQAHSAGLQVYAFTFRSENAFLPADLRLGVESSRHGDAAREYAAFLEAGVDGVITDQPDVAVRALGRGARLPAS